MMVIGNFNKTDISQIISNQNNDSATSKKAAAINSAFGKSDNSDFKAAQDAAVKGRYDLEESTIAQKKPKDPTRLEVTAAESRTDSKHSMQHFKNENKDRILPPSSPYHKRAQASMDRLVPATNRLDPSTKAWEPEIVVVQGELTDTEAMTFGNGKIVISSNALDRYSDIGIDAIVAHELAHDMQEHIRGDLAHNNKGDEDSTTKDRRGKNNELEADSVGMHILKEAKRDPKFMNAWLETTPMENRNTPSSTHSTWGERIDNARKESEHL